MTRKPAKTRQALRPKTPSDALNEAQRLAMAQRLDEAEALLGRFPDDPDCIYRRATVLMTLERWAEAEQGFSRILALAPNHFDSVMGLAGALVEQDRALEAIPLLDAAVRTRADNRTRYCRAVALSDAGRNQEAERDIAAARGMLIEWLEQRDFAPVEVYVQIARRCNLRCTMCGHEVWQSNSGFMEPELFDRVLSECAANGVKRLHVLSGQGEPLLHPQIFEMLEKAVAQGLEVGIVTNGTPLTPERCERLAKLGLSYIQFSFAGWDKESYERTYVGAKFEKVIENLKRMADLIKGGKTNFMVKAVCSGDNWAEVRDRTRDFLAAHGVDRVFTVIANNFGGHVQHGTFYERHQVWSLKNLAHQLRMPCRVFLKAVGVFCDGTVTACGCYDSNAELKIGHIQESSLADIRKGAEFRRILDAFRNGDLAQVAMCGKCDDPFG
ncbi:MAG TPA: radical SAM protein [Magnetospirillum sp.]|jgi:MoaA/NifB/PqqE/SkfB family radical SAM enzyme|nr:radical SAM protein [Magnetospirillum sp.]